MIRIGIVGAENSHTAAIAKILNVEKRVKGASVVAVWGETEAFAQAAAEAGDIPTIVRKPTDMLDEIDAVIVDHRHPRHHLKAALPFVERGIPAFVDKPFCFTSAEGKSFLKLARKHGTPVTSFSTIPRQQSFKRFQKRAGELGELLAGATAGACDLSSKYGGVFFYGIHQVETALNAFGFDVSSVTVTRNGNGTTAQLLYRNGMIVTLNLIKAGCRSFSITAWGNNGSTHAELKPDRSMYLSGVRTFVRMFRTGEEPLPHERILRPVQVLEAMDRALKSGSRERVRK